MGRISDWPGPSERTAKIILAVLAALIVGVFVVRAFVPGFGNVEGRHHVVDIGQSIEILVKRAGNEQVTMTVTELTPVTDAQREQWRIRPALAPVGSNNELDGSDVYFVRYTVSSDDVDELIVVPRLWRLLDDEGTVHEGTLIGAADEANCGHFDGMGGGCAIIAVPAGSEIVEVRFYGVALDRKIIVGENWAGWTV